MEAFWNMLDSSMAIIYTPPELGYDLDQKLRSFVILPRFEANKPTDIVESIGIHRHSEIRGVGFE